MLDFYSSEWFNWYEVVLMAYSLSCEFIWYLILPNLSFLVLPIKQIPFTCLTTYKMKGLKKCLMLRGYNRPAPNMEWTHKTDHFLQRNIKSCPFNVKIVCYQSMVRSTLDYASIIWSPHTCRKIFKLWNLFKGSLPDLYLTTTRPMIVYLTCFLILVGAPLQTDEKSIDCWCHIK